MRRAEAAGCHKWSANVWIHLYDFKGAHGKGALLRMPSYNTLVESTFPPVVLREVCW